MAAVHTEQPTRAWRGASQTVEPHRIRRFGAWYVAEYRLRNLSKWWAAIVAFGLGNPVLYLASFGFGIGALVDRGGAAPVPDGVAYLTFLAPALLATAAIQATQDEVTFPLMHGLKWERVFYAIQSTAVTTNQLAQGIMLCALLRAVFTAGIYWLVLALVGAFTSVNAFLAMPAAIFAGLAMASVMFALTVRFIDSQNYLATVGRFILTPMFMFSGTFFPLESMPLAARWLGWVSPLWHATDLGRVLTYGRDIPASLVLLHIVYLAALTVGGFVIGQRLLRRQMTG